MKKFYAILIFLCSAFLQGPVLAWDAVGHRVSAAFALNYISADKQQLLLEILQQHPRYQIDFVDAMPTFISAGTADKQLEWLLGQAAFWPDMARNFPRTDATRFNRPSWHYLDGAWVRDKASSQGNVYIGIRPFADIPGELASSIRTDAQVTNVMTALDYNTRVLADSRRSGSDRAVALCWVLHLIGDIHQPLHAGSMFSETLFKEGDRGGNEVQTDQDNLHARWDRALSNLGVQENLERISSERESDNSRQIGGLRSDWSEWLAESRRLLTTAVYSDDIKTAITTAERNGQSLSSQRLNAYYVSNMRRLADQQLANAGFQIAVWIENEL